MTSVQSDRDQYKPYGDHFEIKSGRDGMILLFEKRFDARKGFILEGEIELSESRTMIETHHHSAHFGIYLESGTNVGTAMVLDTHGVTRTGFIQYADHKICDHNFRNDVHSASILLNQRSGELKGLMCFDCQDTAGPYGHANASDLRHGSKHSFKFLARGEFFELYIDDYYVQTFITPDTFTGRAGIIVCDGTAICSHLTAWDMDL